MNRDREIDMMAALPLFAGIERQYLEILAFSAERLVFLEGDCLTKKGWEGDAAYLILSGSAKRPGVRQIGFPDQYFFDGALLGDLAMLVEFNHDQDHVALTDTYVLEFSRVLVHGMMRRFPEIGLSLSARLTERLAEQGNIMRAIEHERKAQRRQEFEFLANRINPPSLAWQRFRERARSMTSAVTRMGLRA